jgi:hypothetical protein
MRSPHGTIGWRGDRIFVGRGRLAEIPDDRIFVQGARNGYRTAACDKASPTRRVMLHLRVCYVSKAAILTIPTHHVPVENRSPA